MKLFIFLLLFSSVCSAQGVIFEKDLTWKQVKEKAAREGKGIFVDCYATWCGPCKWMTNQILSKPKVGGYLNEHFICISIQMDQTPNDPLSIKRWYDEAKTFTKEYSVNAYPTYLTFSKEGKPLHRVVGATRDGDAFISKISESFLTQKNYYGQIANLSQHLNDTAYLRNAFQLAVSLKDDSNAVKIRTAYLAHMSLPLSVDDVFLLNKAPLQSTTDPFFSILIDNLHLYNSYYEGGGRGKTFITQILSIAIVNDDIDSIFLSNKGATISYSAILKDLSSRFPVLGDELVFRIKERFDINFIKRELSPLTSSKGISVNWQDLRSSLERRYPDYNFDSAVSVAEIKYNLQNERWDDYERTLSSFVDLYFDRLSIDQINNICWNYVFLQHTKNSLLKKAIKWQLRIVNTKTAELSEYMDTLSNLFYKSGDKDLAIDWERKAIAIAINDKERERFQKVLTKIESSVPTWE